MPAMYVATAAWGIPREQRGRCPDPGTLLQKYASLLNATEINSTFYRRHRPATFERWAASVPDSFRFSVKLPRWITHEAALASPRLALQDFFDDVRGLGAKLGPILVQLPGSLPFEARRAAAFFRALRAAHGGAVACEPRHASWYEPRVSALLAEFGVARVVADPPRPAAARLPDGDQSLLYVRWHGSPDVYWSAYGEERLRPLVATAVSQQRDTAVWCVFDNTASGAALADALLFNDLIRAQQPSMRAGTGARARTGSRSRAGLRRA